MPGQTRLAVAAAIVLRNPATLFFILPLLALAIPLLLLIGAGWLLLKIAEAFFAKPQAYAAQPPLVRLPDSPQTPELSSGEPQRW